MKKYILGSLSIILLIMIWFLYAVYIDNIYILPGPLKVFQSFITLLVTFQTYKIIFFTLFRLLIAFIISGVLGIFLGILAGNSKSLDYFLNPVVSTLRTLPVASIIIIIIILMGRNNSLYIITFLMIFPLVYEASKQGVTNISQSLKNNIAIENHPKYTILTRIQLPLAMPYIRTSLFQSIGLGFKVIVMAEFISQTNIGIGKELFNGSISINYHIVFAWTLIIIIIVFLFEIILKNIQKAYEI